MLDDLKLIHQCDTQDALGVAAGQWQQLEYKFETEQDVMNRGGDGILFGAEPISNIVLAGMGGSALAAEIAQVWPGFDVPFEVCRNYKIPRYVDESTLFIASSYSGNTEETLAALAMAEDQKAAIAVITSAGQLAEIAAAKRYPLFKIPSGLQPRHAVLYNFKALLTLLAESEMFDLVTPEHLETVIIPPKAAWLKEKITAWLPTVPTAQNQAKQIALECIGKSVVIYGSPLMAPVAYKWKISFNENAKHIAWWNQYSEFNHNEFIGWSKQPVDKPYTVIDLRSNLEHPQIQKRFEISAKLLSGLRPDPIVIKPEGDTILEQLLWTIALGDFVTLYTAILNNINPTPVDLIEKLKKELAQIL